MLDYRQFQRCEINQDMGGNDRVGKSIKDGVLVWESSCILCIDTFDSFKIRPFLQDLLE